MNAKSAIALVERGVKTSRVVELMLDPALTYPDGTEPKLSGRMNTRASSGPEDFVVSPEDMPDSKDTEKDNAGSKRRTLGGSQGIDN